MTAQKTVIAHHQQQSLAEESKLPLKCLEERLGPAENMNWRERLCKIGQLRRTLKSQIHQTPKWPQHISCLLFNLSSADSKYMVKKLFRDHVQYLVHCWSFWIGNFKVCSIDWWDQIGNNFRESFFGLTNRDRNALCLRKPSHLQKKIQF